MKVLSAALTRDEPSDGQTGDDAAAVAPPAPAQSVVEAAGSGSSGSNLNGDSSDTNGNDEDKSRDRKKPQNDIAELEAKWWAAVERPDGTSFANYSAHEATEELALWLVRNNGYRAGGELVEAFFCHHFSCLNPSQTGARSNVNLEFARCWSARRSYFFPSEKAWVVAEFQLTDADKGAANLLRLFPKYTCSVMSGFEYDGPSPLEQRAFGKIFRIIMDLTSSFPRLLNCPWAWPPQLPELKDYKFTMPLLTALLYDDGSLSRASARELTQDLLKHLKASGSPDADAYWHLKQCIVRDECKSEDDWREKLIAKEKETKSALNSAKRKVTGASAESSDELVEVDKCEQQLLLLQQVRKIERLANRSGKSSLVKLQQQTVMQLDI